MDNKFIVNIGRQLGSGGREIGEKLCCDAFSIFSSAFMTT